LLGPFPRAEVDAERIGRLMAGQVEDPMTTTRVVAAETVVTLDDPDRIHAPGHVVIEDGLIAEIGEGRATRLGALDLGARNLVALDTMSMRRGPLAAQPLYSSIVWAGGAASVTDAMVAGARLYRDRTHLTLDPLRARAECDVAFAELRALTDAIDDADDADA